MAKKSDRRNARDALQGLRLQVLADLSNDKARDEAWKAAEAERADFEAGWDAAKDIQIELKPEQEQALIKNDLAANTDCEFHPACAGGLAHQGDCFMRDAFTGEVEMINQFQKIDQL